VGSSAIASNFNGTAIPPGDTLWFSAAFKINGLASSPVTFNFTNDTISYTLKGVTTTVNAPNAEITLSPSVTTATTTFNAATNTWETSLPMKFSGNAFLDAVAVPMPNGLPGGANPVTWQGNFTSTTSAVSINWQWAAAVYTKFSTDYNALNVKPVDDNHVSAYQNSDHAGTPEAFTPYVIGGARGGGGSNFTGSMSATASVTPAPPASVSGFVEDTSNNPLSGVGVNLVNSQGATVATATTDTNGFYQFTSLPPDVYTVTVPTPEAGYQADHATAGTVNGSTDGTVPSATIIATVNLTSGNVGVNYDFFEGKQAQQAITTISGTVTAQDSSGNSLGPVPGATVNLLDSNGHIVAQGTTDEHGNYSITVMYLLPGTYSLVVLPTASDAPLGATPGTVSGATDGTASDTNVAPPKYDTIGSIMLVPGNAGINYDFLMQGS
jgi:hypothetical protein